MAFRLGVVTIFDLDKPGKRGIVDGQHRIGGLHILLNQGFWEPSKTILTEVYCVEENAVKDLFKEINQAQPVIEIDMPDSDSDYSKHVVDATVEKLRSQFAAMFSPSQRCRAPNVNVDVLRQKLFDADVVHSLLKSNLTEEQNIETLHNFIIDINNQLSQRTDEQWKSMNQRPSFQKALEKSKDNQFFLGIDTAWI